MRQIFLRVIALVVASAIMAGCDAGIAVKAEPAKKPTPHDAFVQSCQGNKYSCEAMRLLIYEDGTRCLVYASGHAGGLSCDWAKAINTKNGG